MFSFFLILVIKYKCKYNKTFFINILFFNFFLKNIFSFSFFFYLCNMELENYEIINGEVWLKTHYCEKSKRMKYAKKIAINNINGYKYYKINGKLEPVFKVLKDKCSI